MLAEALGSSEGAFSNTESGWPCLPVTLVVLGIIRGPSVPFQARSGTPRQYTSYVSCSSLYLLFLLLPDQAAYRLVIYPKALCNLA